MIKYLSVRLSVSSGSVAVVLGRSMSAGVMVCSCSDDELTAGSGPHEGDSAPPQTSSAEEQENPCTERLHSQVTVKTRHVSQQFEKAVSAQQAASGNESLGVRPWTRRRFTPPQRVETETNRRRGGSHRSSRSGTDQGARPPRGA